MALDPAIWLQVFVADVPPGISAVDGDGTETSLLDCISSNVNEIQGECSVPLSTANDATVLACGTASTGDVPKVVCSLVPSM